MRWFSLDNLHGWLIAAATVCLPVAAFTGLPWLWALGLGLAAAAGVMWVRNAVVVARHRTALREFAFAHGWDYGPAQFVYAGRFTGFPFQSSGKRRQLDVLQGNYSGRRCSTFVQHVEYRQGEDDIAVEQFYQVTLTELDVMLPRLDIVPESMYNRLAQALGGVDVEVESAEFNKTWRVRASDRKYAMDVIDPRMMERLLAYDMTGNVIRIEGGAVLVWQSGRASVADLQRRLDVVVAVANRIPAHVIRRFKDAGLGVSPDEPGLPLRGPSWATTPGVFNSRKYTGISGDTDPWGPKR